MTKKHRAPFWDFDGRLFLEAFRQLKTVGIVALVVMCLAAVLLPVGVAIQAYSNMTYGVQDDIIGWSVQRELVTIIQVHPFSLIPMYTLALLMPLIGFSFLNKRRSSDFFHALPVSRAGVFISYFAAIMAWVAVCLFVSTAASVITVSCFPALYQLVWSSILPTLCASLAGALMVAGCMTFAMCITGTVFTNLLVAALLFFTPRVLMWYIGSLIESVVRILPDLTEIPILNTTYNIPLAVLFGLVDGVSTYNVLNNWVGCLYSAIIGVLYFVGALCVFRVRRSEAAEQPAATPLLQTVYRLTITFLVTLIPVYMIFESIHSKYKLDQAEWFGVFVLYLVAALAFCVYELITTKKPKLLLKTAPTFLIVLVADAVLIGCMSLGVNNILAFRPTAEQIQSVSFETTGYYTDNTEYFNALTAEVKITDADTIRTVAEQLERAAKENNPRGGLKTEGEYECFNITVRTKGAEKVRMLYFIPEQAEKIYAALQKDDTYQAAYQLPALNGDMQVTMWYLSDQQQAENVYRKMCEEAAKLPFETRYAILQQNHHEEAQAFTVTVDVSLSRFGQIYHLNVPLLAEYYPQAYNLYLQYIYENETVDRAEIIDWLSKIKTEQFDLSMQLYFPNAGYEAYADINTAFLSEQIQTLLSEQLLPQVQNTPFDANDYILDIHLSTPKEGAEDEDYQYMSYSAHFAIPAELAQPNGIFHQICEQAELLENSSGEYAITKGGKYVYTVVE